MRFFPVVTLKCFIDNALSLMQKSEHFERLIVHMSLILKNFKLFF